MYILKIDFEKAFDTVEYSAITQMMQQLGFTEKWITWVNSILTSATTSILLNGVPGNTIQCKRGVRQGDPLSPLMFVLAADLLQGVVNRACQLGLLTPPLQNANEQDYPIVQYADDTILIMKASQRELFNLKGILQTFTMSTGLKVNFNKTCLVPINMSQDKTQIMAGTFGCSIESIPFTYLGLPLGTTKPTIEDHAPLVNKIERRLSATSTYLALSGNIY